MRTIGVVTVGRSDYGIYRPLLRRIAADPDLRLQLIVTGMHLASQYGLTVHLIEGDGFEINHQIEMLLASDTPSGVVKSMGLALTGFADLFGRVSPDVLVVLGDRFEMMAPALAALPFKIPVAHIHGGEVTYGAIDDALRHTITKLSHLHFASTEAYARRIIQMGEAPWRVTVSGAPGLDNLHEIDWLTVEQIKARFKLTFDRPPLLVTFHPVTLEIDQTVAQIDALLEALTVFDLPMVFTMPNADPSNRLIYDRIQRFIETHERAEGVDNFGVTAYFSMMRHAAAMVGNSSSGLIEAPSFHLPVVNIGNRQRGRVRGGNVIDVASTREAIIAGIKRALSAEFRAEAQAAANPYYAGQLASEIILARLKSVALDDRLITKEFYDGNG